MKSVLILIGIALSTLSFAEEKVIKILVDPGHGGKDPGHLPMADTLKQEKDLALEIALKVGTYLTENLSNIEVDYTRTTDVYPTLDERVDQANAGFDYMISIHINGSPRGETEGTETIIHNFEAKDSYLWAKLIQQEFKKNANRTSRGVKTSADLGHTLQVLKYTKIPAVIVECGFITNSEECQYLHSVNGQEILASAIFRATRSFLQKKHPDIVFDSPIEDEEEELADNGYLAFPVNTTLEPEIEPEPEVQPHYMVQIMASIDPVETTIPDFIKLNRPVTRVLVEGGSIYKYKYYIGPFEDRKDAKSVQKEVQQNGFEDAFLVHFQ